MRDCYIPDLTERFPEGLDGGDMFEPYDIEGRMWADMEREYRESEQREIERITRAGYSIIKQTAAGWTLAETNESLILCTIKNGEIIDIYSSAKNRPDNYKSMFITWREIANEEERKANEEQ